MTDSLIPPTHPGEVLLKDFLEPLGMTPYALAKAINVPPIRINDIVNGKRSITADTALRLARYWGNDAQFWLGLQNFYDIEKKQEQLTDDLHNITPRAA